MAKWRVCACIVNEVSCVSYPATVGVVILTQPQVGVVFLTRPQVGVVILTQPQVGVVFLTRPQWELCFLPGIIDDRGHESQTVVLLSASLQAIRDCSRGGASTQKNAPMLHHNSRRACSTKRATSGLYTLDSRLTH